MDNILYIQCTITEVNYFHLGENRDIPHQQWYKRE